MGKISDNGGVYMTIITNDMTISKIASQLLLTINLIKCFKTISMWINKNYV